MLPRKGLTIAELVVCIAIMALLSALLIPAIQNIREVALRTKSQNNLRQFGVAVHNFASTQGGSLPSINGHPRSANAGKSLFWALLPYTEGSTRIFISPADPTVVPGDEEIFTSYAANGLVFIDTPSLGLTFADGTSNTIAFAEHYAASCGASNSQHFFLWLQFDLGAIPFVFRRATFADPAMDVNPPVPCVPSLPVSGAPHWTFQIGPPVENCDHTVAQTPHRTGMLVAMGDGSSRIVSPSVSVGTYWAAVTPAGGEILSNDW
jgi:type II secretory pathway pseudopilin PulG